MFLSVTFLAALHRADVRPMHRPHTIGQLVLTQPLALTPMSHRRAEPLQ